MTRHETRKVSCSIDSYRETTQDWLITDAAIISIKGHFSPNISIFHLTSRALDTTHRGFGQQINFEHVIGTIIGPIIGTFIFVNHGLDYNAFINSQFPDSRVEFSPLRRNWDLVLSMTVKKEESRWESPRFPRFSSITRKSLLSKKDDMAMESI